uniref:Uncharacterized protein n=1 Tax=Alexandrium monilatum TaxID=311494 RepID=A0A6T1N1A3_9DINO
MASRVAALALASFTMAAGHPEGEDTARRLFYVEDKHIWGSPAQCSSHVSAGPADADIEIRIGGLPNSTSSKPVHLQWWAPRASATTYDPLTSAVNCSVHANVVVAYPKYSDADFNGGNVRVSEAGEAVIRVRAPATYLVWRYVAVPHIHLRLCEGASDIKRSNEAVMMAGVDMWISSVNPHTFQIVSAGPYAGRSAASSSANPSAPGAVAVIVRVVGTIDRHSSTLPASTTVEATTPAPTTPAAVSQRSAEISAARDALDLNALEFSPVYRCLLDQKYFDHFSTGCADSCPADSTVAHGQCVREETADPRAQVETSWQLEVECGSPCWQDAAMKSSLHGTRLSIAGHLDIAFQEVEISLSLATSSSRRLSTTKTAHLTAKVNSNRLSSAQTDTLLTSFPQGTAFMSTLLGLNVLTVTTGTPPAQSNNPVNMGQGNDPYVPAYNDVEPKTGPTSPTSPVSFLPTEAIIGIAAGVVILAAIVGVLLWRRQRQRRAAAQAQQSKAVEDKTASPNEKTEV